MSAFFLAGAGTSAGRQGAKLGLYCSAWGSSCLCQLFSLFVSFQLRVKVLRCRLGLRRCKRTDRVSLSGRILGAQSLVLGSRMMSKYIEPWSRRRFASGKSLDFPALTSKANEPCLSGYKLQLGLTGMTRKISSCSWPMPKNSKKPSEILKRCAT